MSLVFSQKTCDSGETPILIGLTKLGRVDAPLVQLMSKLLEFCSITDRKMDKGRVVVFWSTKPVGVLYACVSGLHCLLRDRNVAARDSVEISFRRVLHGTPLG